MGKLGFDVDAYEPDPAHFKQLTNNLKLNNIQNVACYNSAVSDFSGTTSVIKVLGNTTASHLSEAKDAYGDLETFEVNVCDIRTLMNGVDLVKVDIEGMEATIFEALDQEHFERSDFIVEVGNEKVRSRIFQFLKNFQSMLSRKNLAGRRLLVWRTYRPVTKRGNFLCR